MAKPSPLENHLDIVGVIPDREVAVQLGMTAENVRAWRNRRGIPAGWRKGAATPKASAKAGKPAATATRTRTSAIDRFEHLLGVIPDATIAHFTGLKLATVGKARAKRGLPAAASQDGPPPRHRRSKMDPFLHLLGKEPDAEVAKRSGVSAKNVSNFRRRHGIPSARQLSRVEAPSAQEAPEPVVETPVVATPEPVVVAAPAETVQWAFKATVDRAGVLQTYVVFGADLAAAAALATSRIGADDRLTMLESVATVL